MLPPFALRRRGTGLGVGDWNGSAEETCIREVTSTVPPLDCKVTLPPFPRATLESGKEPVVASIGAAREITKAPKVNIIGLCAGGILSSMVSAHLSATGRLDQVASLGLGVTLVDMTEAGTTVSFMDETVAKASGITNSCSG